MSQLRLAIMHKNQPETFRLIQQQGILQNNHLAQGQNYYNKEESLSVNQQFPHNKNNLNHLSRIETISRNRFKDKEIKIYQSQAEN